MNSLLRCSKYVPLFIAFNMLIGCAMCHVTEVTICDFGSTSSDCNLERGRVWELHTNLCKEDAPPCNDNTNFGRAFPRCDPEFLDNDKIAQYAVQVQARNMLPMVCDNSDDNLQLAVGIVLLKSHFVDVAIKHFTMVIEKAGDDSCAAFYFGRAQCYAELGLEHPNSAAHALSDYTKALHAAKKSDVLQIYETRADAFQALGQHGHAYNDYSEAIKKSPTSDRLFLLRGISLVFMDRHRAAYRDLQETLRLEPNQITAMHYLTTCLFHMRQFDQAIQVFKNILALKPDHNEVYESMAQTYREVGDFKKAIEYYNKALTYHRNNAVLHQRKATLLYNTGQLEQALESYKSCAALDPFNILCKFMKGACYAGMGQFYPAIKEMTMASSDRPVRQPKGDYMCPTTMFLREWCRYIHSHLDDSVEHFSADEDLTPGFKENWSYDLPFSLQNYTEQPGLQPHIRDITASPWNRLSDTRQKLLCYAYRTGKAAVAQSTYFASDAIHDRRVHLMLGMATVEVAQTVMEFWSAPKSYRNKDGKRFTWKDAFDVSVKWIRFVDLNLPSFWMDNANELSKPYTQQLILIQNNETKPRYEKYLSPLYRLLERESDAPHREFSSRGVSNPVEYFQYLLNHEKTHIDYQTGEPYLTTGSKVASKKERSQKTLDGCNIILQYDRLHKVTLVYDCKTPWPKAKQYHSELDFIWQKLADEYKKIGKSNGSGNPTESLINLILSLTYYFLNLMPISKGTSTVGYSLAIGLPLALGREANGKIPKGRDFFMDAITTFEPDKFRSTTKSWLSFKRTSNGAGSFEKVAESFPTYRSMLEILHYDLSNLCTLPE